MQLSYQHTWDQTLYLWVPSTGHASQIKSMEIMLSDALVNLSPPNVSSLTSYQSVSKFGFLEKSLKNVKNFCSKISKNMKTSPSAELEQTGSWNEREKGSLS
jgi:hypothetical protein